MKILISFKCMPHAIFAIFIFFSIFFTKISCAQRLNFKNYTINDGLVANNVRRVYQDSKGFLWIATIEGVSKYDGYRFTNFTIANGLSHSMVNDFYESKDGKIYVTTNNGTIDVIGEKKAIQKTITSPGIINRFLPAYPGKVIMTTDKNGFLEFNNGNLSKPNQPFPSLTYSDAVWLNDSLFMTTGDSVIQIFNKDYELLAELTDPLPLFNEASIYKDSKKRIWIGTPYGLKLILPSNQRNKLLSLSPLPTPFDIPELQRNSIYGMLEDAEGTLWIGTSGGLVKIRADDSRQMITFKEGLLSDNITCIFQDNEKNIWLGTASGLSKIITKSNIRTYSTENGLLSNNFHFIYPVKKNHLLASTSKGLQVFNTLTGKFLPVANPGSEQFTSLLPNNHPIRLFAANKVVTFDTATLQLSQKNNQPFDNYYYIGIGSGKDFFLGAHYNAYFFSSRLGTAISILDYRCTILLIDKKEYLWVGTWDQGIYRFRYRIENDQIEIVETNHYLAGESVRSILEDSKGNIWIGTRYTGVYAFKNGQKPQLTYSFNQENGLTSNSIKCISEDKAGNIWIGFYQGLDKLILQDSAYRVFNFSRINNYFTSVVGIEPGENNSLWLATTEGMVHITDGMMERLAPLPVYITKINSPDSTYVLSKETLQLNHRHNQLQFEFSAPGFINETQILYSYRLAGSPNADWTKPDNQHQVAYANLKPGSYQFEVRTLGWNGEWGNITSFEFVILPPFWKTWWFILLLSLAAIGLIYFLIKRRIATIRHEAEMKNKIAETEMMALRAQMNPHFIFNCLNSIDNLIQTDQKEKATDYLAKFARLIRAILENSKSNTIPCWKDLEALKLYLQMEELRWDKKITCTVTIANEIQNGDYKVPPMIIQPFVENAIHHGLLNKITPDKKLSIDVKLEGTKIKYTITDNGVGRLKAGEYKKLNRTSPASFGIQITKDRINLFNQDANNSVKITDLYNKQQQPEGTMAEVWLTTQPLTT